jgi:transcriptional antiterminator RfaH
MTVSGTHWYVVQSQPNAEAKAVANLNRQGFDTYLPRYLKRRRHARRVETVAASLFPRYLFVAVDVSAQRWRSIFSTVGVSRLVCNGDLPTPMANGIIDALKAREDERGFILLDQKPKFRPGDTVRVLDGAFADYLGLYEGMKDGCRVAILLDLLGRKVRATVDAESVAVA